MPCYCDFNLRFRDVPTTTTVKEVTQEYDCKAYDTGCAQISLIVL